MYRNYYSYNDMPSVAKKSEPSPVPYKPAAPAVPPPNPTPAPKPTVGFLQNLSADDIILLAVIFLLLTNGCNDKLLLAAIGFVFLTGIVL